MILQDGLLMKIKLLLVVLVSNLLSVSFDKAYKSALRQNPKLIEASLILDSKKFAVDKTKTSLLPKISYSGTLQRENIDSSTSSDVRLSNNKLYNLNINQVIYSSDLNFDIKKSKINNEIEEFKYEETLQSVILDFTNRYFEWLKAYNNLSVASKNVELATQYKQKVDKLFSLGLSSKTDLLKAISQYYEAVYEKELVEQQYIKQQNFLSEYIGLNINIKSLIKTDELLFSQFIKVGELDEYVNDINFNTSVKIAKLESYLHKLEIDKLESSWTPSVHFVADYSKTSRSNDTYYENTNGKVQFQGTLYQGGYVGIAKQEATAIYKSYRQKEIVLIDSLKLKISGQYIKLIGSKNSYIISNKRIETLKSELNFLKQSSKFGIKELEKIISVQKQILEEETTRFASLVDSISLYLYLNISNIATDKTIINKISSIVNVK